jgi:Domain of unknown function (DUF4833)
MLKNKIIYTVACLTNLVVLSFVSPCLANNIEPVFYISKSENGNRVHYDIKLDQRCSPMGDKPVYVYWQMANGDRKELIPLVEEPVYGIASQKVSISNVDIVLKAIQDKRNKRTIRLETSKINGKCQVKARIKINGNDEELSHIYVNSAEIKKNILTGTITITLFSKNKQKETITCSGWNC